MKRPHLQEANVKMTQKVTLQYAVSLTKDLGLK